MVSGSFVLVSKGKYGTVSVSDISHCEFILIGKCKLYEPEMRKKVVRKETCIIK